MSDGLSVKSHSPAITPVQQSRGPAHQKLQEDWYSDVVSCRVYEESPVLEAGCI